MDRACWPGRPRRRALGGESAANGVALDEEAPHPMIDLSNSHREILSAGAASAPSGGPAAYAGMDRAGWLEAGRRLAARTTRDRWALGDWAACAGRHHGDLTLAAREIGLSAGARRGSRGAVRAARRAASRRRDPSPV